MTFAPVVSVKDRLQVATPLAVAAPPEAACPFTVTLTMPLPPVPLSVAVPLIVAFAELTVWPDVWLVIANVGATVSPIVHVNDLKTARRPSNTDTVTL
jgi:hypothetical protein